MKAEATNSERWQPRSLYAERIGEIQHYLDSVRKPVLLVGGRGVGKSSVLSKLKLKNPLLITVRNEAINSQLVNRVKKYEGAILVDDIDEKFTEESFQLLAYLAQHHRYPVAITSTIPPDVKMLHEHQAFENLPWDLRLLASWSDVTAPMQRFRIDPWAPGWRKRVARLVEEFVQIDVEFELAGWTTILLDLTGGHPVLLDPALEALSHAPKRQKSPGAEKIEPRWSIEWKQQHAKFEEHLFGDALRKLRKVIAWLDALSPSAGEALRLLARTPAEDPEPPLSVATRKALLASGLVYRTPSQELVVAGEVLRHSLAGESSATRPPVSVNISETAGDIRVSVADSTYRIPLRRASLKLVGTLDRSNRPLTIEDLERETELNGGALRSAIQRVRADFDGCGVAGIIENVWGEGYRIGVFPLLIPEKLAD